LKRLNRSVVKTTPLNPRKNKAVTEKDETHVERKQGIATCVHGTGRKHEVGSWITSIVSSQPTSSSLEEGSLEVLALLFKRVGINDKEMRVL